MLKKLLTLAFMICPLCTLAINSDSANIPLPHPSPMVLCPQVYVNDALVTSTDQNTSITSNTSSCTLTYSNQPAVYYFTSTVVGLPVGVTMTTADSTMACPSDHPVPQTVILHADQGIGQTMYSVRAYCCQAGITMRVESMWIPGTTCP